MIPNSFPPALRAVLEQRPPAPTTQPDTQPANPINPEDAAALILSLLADPSGRIVPAEAYKLLAERN